MGIRLRVRLEISHNHWIKASFVSYWLLCVCVCERERERERESIYMGGWYHEAFLQLGCDMVLGKMPIGVAMHESH